jgi:PadR family transcriptional regulator
MGREGFSGHLDLLLLAALRSEPRHGYAVIEHMRSASGGRFDYPEGTVYPALHRLEAEGLLRSRWSEVDGRRRRVYELTGKGRTALDGRRREWERFTQSVGAVLEGT